MYTPDQLRSQNCFALNQGQPFFIYWWDGTGYRRFKVVGYKHGAHLYQQDYVHLPGEVETPFFLRTTKHKLAVRLLANCHSVLPDGLEEKRKGRFLWKT